MRTGRIVITGAAALALVAGGTAAGAAIAASPIDSSGVIHGCYYPASKTGSSQVVLQNTGTSCPKGTTAVSWNQQGQTGPAGPAGAPGPAGLKGDTGAQGPAGTNGATGPAGPTGPGGADGKTVLNGTGAPDITIGSDGDFYLDTSNEVLYGPKAGGAWPTSGTSLVGPQGPTGAIGGVDTLIGTPCDVGTPAQGTLTVTYTPQTNSTDSINLGCTLKNSRYAVNVSVLFGSVAECTFGPSGCTQPCPPGGACTIAYPSLTFTASEPGAITCTPSDSLPNLGMAGAPPPGTLLASCTGAFPGTSTVTITAVPDAVSAVGSWTGCDSVSADGSSCTVTVNAVRNISVVANGKGNG